MNFQFPISNFQSKIRIFNFVILKFIILLGIGYLLFGFAKHAFAVHVSANISTANSERHAWNDIVGWIDFGSGEVEVTSAQLRGYANALQIGFVGLDCATSPNGNICGGPAGSWGVSNSSGVLAGWAWNDNIGWISFNCSNTGTCGTSPYSVSINTLTGDFSGWAWNDVIGWISFNCVNSGTNGCASPGISYKVKTSFYPAAAPSPGSGGGFGDAVSLISSIFDTQVVQGAAINTIMWNGSLGGGAVGFQIASSNDLSGPWNFVGPDGSGVSYYEPAPNLQMKVSITGANNHNNKRYVRYKLFLDKPDGTTGPEVQDVIIGYSP
jgi:hypothetical protein